MKIIIFTLKYILGGGGWFDKTIIWVRGISFLKWSIIDDDYGKSIKLTR
jgi:hypothetical protein